jgi:hypothetical protein
MAGAKAMLLTARVQEYTDFIAANTHRHLHGARRGTALSTPMPIGAPSRQGAVYTDTYKDSPARRDGVHHQVYSDVHNIIDIVHALTRRRHTPPTCPSPMKQTTTCFADEAKASHPIRHQQGGHHKARHRRGEGHPHLYHRALTSRRDTAKHHQSDGRTAPPFYITTILSPTWRRRDLKTTTIAAA